MIVLNNSLQTLIEYIRKYIFIFTPIIANILWIFLMKIEVIEIPKSTDYVNNVVNLSGILAGFLFTAYGIFMSLPDNKFISALKHTGYMDSIYKVLIFGILFLITSMLIGLYTHNYKILTISFISGISETIISLYYFYKILKYSSLSN